MFMWRSAPGSCSFTQLVSQAVGHYPATGLRTAQERVFAKRANS